MKKILIWIFTLILFISMMNTSLLANQTNLNKDIQNLLNQYPNAEITFYYENLGTGESISYNPKMFLPAASTRKAALALYIYTLATHNQLSLDKELTYQSQHYYGGSGSIQYEKIGTKYTIRELVKRSVRESDNIAYIMLRRHIGSDNYLSFAKSIGGAVTLVNSTESFSSKALASHMKALYQFVRDHDVLGKELLGFFTDTIYNDLIPSGVPELIVAHKVGWFPIPLIYNDAAIIYDKNPYILVIMTKGISDRKRIQFFTQLTALIQEQHEQLNKSLPSDWAITEINQAIQNNLIPDELQNGYQNNITRQEFCQLILQLLLVNSNQDLDTFKAAHHIDEPTTPFTDTTHPAIITLYQLGIISGKGNGRFEPDGTLTRQEAAVILANSAQTFGFNVEQVDFTYEDDSEIASWSNTAVYFNYYYEIMKGVSDQLFYPTSPYSKEQAYLSVNRLFNLWYYSYQSED